MRKRHWHANSNKSFRRVTISIGRAYVDRTSVDPSIGDNGQWLSQIRITSTNFSQICGQLRRVGTRRTNMATSYLAHFPIVRIAWRESANQRKRQRPLSRHSKRLHDPSKRSIARWENEGGATKNGRDKRPNDLATLQRSEIDRRRRRPIERAPTPRI